MQFFLLLSRPLNIIEKFLYLVHFSIGYSR